MARITRVFQPIFAESATNNGQFGSAQAGTKITTNDLATLMALPAWASGWLDAVIGASKFPALEEFQSISYITTTQLAYIFQEGIPEYDADTNYFTKSIVKEAGTYKLYGSVTNNNSGNALSDAANWTLLVDLASVANDWALHIFSVTGNTFAPDATYAGSFIKRSNSATAMTDTLPGTVGALDAGWASFFTNTDASANDTIGVGGGGTIRVGSNATANSFVVNPGDIWLVVSSGTGNYTAMRVASSLLLASGVTASRSLLAGAYASSTTAAWTANALVLSDVLGNSKRITGFSQGINTAVTGIGGKTSALSNSNWYPVYAGLNPSSGVVGAYIDATQNYSTPTPPSGFTYNCLIGDIFIDSGGAVQGFTQVDDLHYYKLGSSLSSVKVVATGGAGDTNVPTYVSATVRGASSMMPPNAVTGIFGIASQSNDGISVILAPNNSYGPRGSLTNPPPIQQSNASNGGVLNTSAYGEMILEANSVQYAIAAGSGGSNQAILGYGFRMNL